MLHRLRARLVFPTSSGIEYRQAESKDIVEDAEIFIFGDDEQFHRMVINEVLRPTDKWKAFCADDGCRYGLDGCFVRVGR